MGTADAVASGDDSEISLGYSNSSTKPRFRAVSSFLIKPREGFVSLR